ncbi:hypothetical protein WA556_005203, partial [Blastocystis sp. ATCC 50177/Nand II]
MYSTSIDLEDIDPRNLKKCTQCRKYKRISSFISKRGRKLCLLCDACRNLFSVYRSRRKKAVRMNSQRIRRQCPADHATVQCVVPCTRWVVIENTFFSELDYPIIV